MSFPSKKRLTLAEVLGNIDFFTEHDEKGSMKSKTTIFVTPLQGADNDLSEQDSADEDCTEFDLIYSRLLNVMEINFCVDIFL